MTDPATYANLACISCGQRAPTILEMVLHCATTHLHSDIAIEDRETTLWLLGRCVDWRCVPAMMLRFDRN